MISRSPVTFTTYLPAFSPSVSGKTDTPFTLTTPTFFDWSFEATVNTTFEPVNADVGRPSTVISLATVTFTA